MLFSYNPITRRLDYYEPQYDITTSGAYGEIYIHDASTPQTIPEGTAYVLFTGWSSDGLDNNCTADSSNNKITITTPGIYIVSISISIKTDTNNVNVLASLFLDGNEQNQIHMRRKIGTANDEGSTSLSGIIDVTSAPKDIDLRFRHDYAGDVDITVTYGNMSIARIG